MSILAETFGCTLIMFFMASILYGVATLQTYIYSQTYTKDPLFLKLLVAIVWVLETAHIAFCILFAYVSLINSFGDLEYSMTHIHWSADVTLICSLVLTLIVHSFYVFRTWIITNGSIPLTSFVVSASLRDIAAKPLNRALKAFFAVTRFGGNLGENIVVRLPGQATLTRCILLQQRYVLSTLRLDRAKVTFPTLKVYSFIFHDWIAFQTHKITTIVIFVGSVSGAIVDILVAGIMVYRIRKEKSGLTQSDNMANRIMVYTINTGALTCITSILIPIMVRRCIEYAEKRLPNPACKFAVDKKSFAYLGLIEVQSKLYSNAFLATLNARQYIRNKFSNNPVTHTNTSINFANCLAQATVTAPEVPVPLVDMMGSDESSTTALSTQKSGPNDLKVEPIM
ncbi:hypothetical protein NM688_g4318 [Phlebia brevispora]|uniref:Uncharacterized protein n=1 Tax=Phlebia brevispora TaxID=194682 RepID=A0ACC1T3E8_9APHY|nr:hypothetical protein NM688_g4318 [Phlebia brevispora]